MNANDLNGIQVAETRNSLHQAFAWNYAQMGTMQRALAAKALGLDPSQFSQMPPGSSVTIISNHAPLPEAPAGTAPFPAPSSPTTPATRASGLTAALLGAALVAGPTLGVLGAWLVNRPVASAPVAIATPPAPGSPSPPPGPVKPDGFIIQQQQQADGSWKMLWSEPAKRLPDGSAQTMDGRRWQQGAGGNWTEVPKP